MGGVIDNGGEVGRLGSSEGVFVGDEVGFVGFKVNSERCFVPEAF